MSKALVIKQADFSTNALTTIVYNDMPCTGISITPDSISLTDLTSESIPYSVSPQNTTDTVIWSSSNESVATVSNGVVTAVGIGSATITATCGNYSDTVTVNVSIAYNENGFTLGYMSSESAKHFMTYTNNTARLCVFGSGNQACEYNIALAAGGGPVYPIKIPNNTASITFSCTDKTKFSSEEAATVRWAKNESCGDSDYPNAAYYVSYNSSTDMPRTGTFTVDVPSGVNAFAAQFKPRTSFTDQDVAKTWAQAAGLTITFNAASQS